MGVVARVQKRGVQRVRDTVGIDRRSRGQQALRPNLATVETWQARAYGIGLGGINHCRRVARQRAVAPASTGIVAPVMYRASSETNQAIALEMSSAWMSCTGRILVIASNSSGTS